MVPNVKVVEHHVIFTKKTVGGIIQSNVKKKKTKRFDLFELEVAAVLIRF